MSRRTPSVRTRLIRTRLIRTRPIRIVGLGAVLLAAVFLVVAILGGVAADVPGAWSPAQAGEAFSTVRAPVRMIGRARADEVAFNGASRAFEAGVSGPDGDDTALARHPSEARAR